MSSDANHLCCDNPFQACLKWMCQKSHPEHESPPHSAQDHTHPRTVSQQPDQVLPMDILARTTPNIQSVLKFTNKQSNAWKSFVDILKVLEASIEVFPPLKSAISALLVCTIHVRVAEQNQQEYDQMARDLTNLVQRLQVHLPDSKPRRVLHSIENAARIIDEQVARIKQQQERSEIGQVIRATDDGIDIIGCYRRIETILRQLQTDVSLSTWDLTHDLWVDARLKDLMPVHDARHDARLSMGMQRRGCTPNTRVEILKQAMSWTRNPSAAKIYWMNGMAGTGKTTIAYTLCDQLEKSKQLGAGFFCSRASPDCRDVNRIAPTIAYQLAQFSYPYQNELCEVLSNIPDITKRDISIQFQRLIVGPLMKVKDTIPTDVVVVIDALDECSDIRGTQLVVELLFQHAISLPVRFFVASRPEPSISTKISLSEDTYRFALHLHDVEESLVQADIHAYLEDELRSIEAKPEEIDRLAVRAGSLFIFAATVVRHIEPRDPTVNHQERLTTLLDAHTTAAGQIYQELDGLYFAILTRSLKEVGGSEAEWRRLVLQAVLVAKEPLTIPDIAELIGAKDEERVRRALMPFLSLLRVSDNEFVTTLHTSFSDFMFDPARSYDFYYDLSKQHAYMATRCFEIMKESLRFNICNIETSCRPDQEFAHIGTRIRQEISSGLSYAARYWGDHLQEAAFSDELANMLDSFLRYRLLFWMEVLNLKNWIGYGAAILLHALNFLLLDDSLTDLRAMVQDSRNFVTTYAASPASQSTPHIYISGLPLTPSQSGVRKTYWPQMNGLFEIKGTTIADRGNAALATWATGALVTALALSKDGRRIISGSGDGRISEWDTNRGTLLLGPLRKHQNTVCSVTFSSDGSRIASGSHDCTICISNPYTGDTLVGPLTAHGKPICCLSFSPNGVILASASEDRTIRIWDSLTGTQFGAELKGHQGPVRGVVFTSHGEHLVSCSDDRTIRVWDWKKGVTVRGPFEGHTGSINSIALSPDDTLIASGSADHTIRLWSIEQGKMIVDPLIGHSDQVPTVAFSSDGRQIVSGSFDQTIRVWSSKTGDLTAGPFRGHEGDVYSVLYSHDGTQLISGSWDGTIRIWDANHGFSSDVETALIGHTRRIHALVILPDGTRAISGSSDHTISVWDMHDGNLILGPLKGHAQGITSLACSPDSTCFISGSWDCTVRTWDTQTGAALVDPFDRCAVGIASLAMSPDGNLIASGARDGSLHIWHRHNGAEVGKLPTHHTDWVWSVAFSPDNAYLASGSHDKCVCLWDAKTGSLIWTSEKQATWVMSVAFSSNSRAILACVHNGIIALDAIEGTSAVPPRQREGYTSQYWTAFSSTNTRAATLANNGTLRLWHADKGTLLAMSFGAVSQMSAIALAPDNRHIISCSPNSTIQFWNVESIKNLVPPGIVSWVISEDGWVRDSESRLIIWLPHDLKHMVPSQACSHVICPQGSADSNVFTNMVYGSHWNDCYSLPLSSNVSDT